MTYPDIIEIAAANPRSGATSASGQHNHIRDAINDLDDRTGVLEVAPPAHDHTEAQITDGSLFARVGSAETITGIWTFNAGKLLDKGNSFHNVKAYGAACDGATDDTTAVQAAIDAAAVSGGLVFFPAGTTISETLTWKTAVYGVGLGVTASILQLKAGTDDDLIKGEDFATLTGGDTVDGIHDWGFRQIALDGNKANNAAGWVVRAYGYRPFFEDVDIRNGNDGGMYSDSFTASDPVATLSKQGSFARTHFHHNGGDGLYYNGPHDAVFVDCWFFYNTGDGIETGERGDGIKLFGCHSYGNDQNRAAAIASTNCKFVGCTFEGSDSYLVELIAGGDGAQFDACHFYAAGTQTTKAGVRVNNVGTFQIRNCTFENLTDGAVVFTDDNGSGHVSGNYIYAASGDAWDDTAPASNTRLEGNYIVGGATGGDGTARTIASGAVTLPPGNGTFQVDGEGAAADVLTNITSEATGVHKFILAGHGLTITHAAGGSGQILTPTGTDYALTQFHMIEIVSFAPNWVIVEG